MDGRGSGRSRPPRPGSPAALRTPVDAVRALHLSAALFLRGGSCSPAAGGRILPAEAGLIRCVARVRDRPGRARISGDRAAVGRNHRRGPFRRHLQNQRRMVRPCPPRLAVSLPRAARAVPLQIRRSITRVGRRRDPVAARVPHETGGAHRRGPGSALRGPRELAGGDDCCRRIRRGDRRHCRCTRSRARRLVCLLRVPASGEGAVNRTHDVAVLDQRRVPCASRRLGPCCRSAVAAGTPSWRAPFLVLSARRDRSGRVIVGQSPALGRLRQRAHSGVHGDCHARGRRRARVRRGVQLEAGGAGGDLPAMPRPARLAAVRSPQSAAHGGGPRGGTAAARVDVERSR